MVATGTPQHGGLTMSNECETYVVFLSSDGQVRKRVKDRSIDLPLPENTFAFFFYDIFFTMTNQGRQRSDPCNYSGTVYYKASFSTPEDAKTLYPEDATHIESVFARGAAIGVVRCRQGQWRAFFQGDMIINE